MSRPPAGLPDMAQNSPAGNPRGCLYPDQRLWREVYSLARIDELLDAVGAPARDTG